MVKLGSTLLLGLLAATTVQGQLLRQDGRQLVAEVDMPLSVEVEDDGAVFLNKAEEGAPPCKGGVKADAGAEEEEDEEEEEKPKPKPKKKKPVEEDDEEDEQISCEADSLPEAKRVDDEPSCGTILPAFYNLTSAEGFDKALGPTKIKTMDHLCMTKCGAVFTLYVLASRAQDAACGRSSAEALTKGIPDVPLEDLKAAHKIRSPPKGGDEEEDAVAPLKKGSDDDIVVEGDEQFGEKPKAKPKKAAAKGKKPAEEVTEEAPAKGKKTTEVTEEARDLIQEHDKAAAEGGKVPYAYPGLTLGCTKAEDNKYCALKKANPGSGECTFFKTCCYGEYLKGMPAADIGPIVDRIEAVCPGSRNYSKKTCYHGKPTKSKKLKHKKA